jgi:hypothetical protein
VAIAKVRIPGSNPVVRSKSSFMHYNFYRVHQSLKGQTPATAAGIADHPLLLTQLVEVLEEWERKAA